MGELSEYLVTIVEYVAIAVVLIVVCAIISTEVRSTFKDWKTEINRQRKMNPPVWKGIPIYVAVFSREEDSIRCEVHYLQGGNKSTADWWMSNFQVDHREGVVTVPNGVLRVGRDRHKGRYRFVVNGDVRVQFEDGTIPGESIAISTQGSVSYTWGEHGVSRSMPIPFHGVDN